MASQPKHRIDCSVCARPAIARRLCKACYYREQRAGRIEEHAKLLHLESFLSRIQIKKGGCWLWQGGTNAHGYGVTCVNTHRQVLAHRHAYELWRTAIPSGAVIMHSCDTPLCVNPEHLAVGTRSENNLDAVAKLRHQHGAKHWRATLLPEQVLAIRRDHRSQSVIAALYGINQSVVSRIKSGRAWRTVAFSPIAAARAAAAMPWTGR